MFSIRNIRVYVKGDKSEKNNVCFVVLWMFAVMKVCVLVCVCTCVCLCVCVVCGCGCVFSYTSAVLEYS